MSLRSRNSVIYSIHDCLCPSNQYPKEQDDGETGPRCVCGGGGCINRSKSLATSLRDHN
jgi:hypothetical protein